MLVLESVFDLSPSVWTTDIDKAESMTGKIRAGSVFVNGMITADPFANCRGSVKYHAVSDDLTTDESRPSDKGTSPWEC
jgi:acyl-CoA reductase-like NAD-dependent aldehyde dehydrogenase